MEIFLRWGLLLIGFFVVALIFYDVWFRRGTRSTQSEDLTPEDKVLEPYLRAEAHVNHEAFTTSPRLNSLESSANNPPATVEDIIILSVLAKPNAHFASYDLLQAIAATGMQYGEMDIFHYYQPTETGNNVLFSLASATKPGKFDLDRMGDFSCVGLTLFMDKRTVRNPERIFLTMLEKAEQLADDLDGEVRIGPRREPWDKEVLERYLSSM